MPDRDLNIRINADVDGAKVASKSIQDIVTKARELDLAFKKGDKSADQVVAGISNLEKSLKTLNVTSAKSIQVQSQLWHVQNRAKLGFTSMAGSMTSLNTAAINFGRVLQDLPFGLIAVANNIEPALYSMRELKKEAAATGDSMFNLTSRALFGPVGMMAAAAAAAAVLPRLIDWLKETGASGKEAAEGIKKANEAMSATEKMVSEIQGLAPAQRESRREILKQSIARLQGKAAIASEFARYGVSPISELQAKRAGLSGDTFSVFQLLSGDEKPDASGFAAAAQRMTQEAQQLQQVLASLNATALQTRGIFDFGIMAGGVRFDSMALAGRHAYEEGLAMPMSAGGVFANGESQPMEIRRPGRGQFPSQNLKDNVIGDAWQLQSDLSPIFAGIGGTISTYIGGAFRSVFGEAKSLAADLFSSILGGLISFGISAGLTAITGGAAAPVLLSRGTTSPGGIVVATNRRRSTGGSGGGGIVLESRISGNDIVVSNQRTQMKRRRYTV